MATFTVTTLDDETEDNGTLSLREAIALAEANAGADQIVFADGLEGTIRLTQGGLFSGDDMSIDGDGRIAISGDANGDDVTDANGITDVEASLAADRLSDNVKILRHYDGDLTLTGLTFTGGASDFDGGAIYSRAANTYIADSVIAGNYNGEIGGGVFAEYDLTLENTVLSGNHAARRGGGAYANGEIAINLSDVSDNSAGEDGGGFYSQRGGITVTGSQLTGNDAGQSGAAIYTQYAVTIIDSEVSGNTGPSTVLSGQDLLVQRASFLNNDGNAIQHVDGVARIEDSAFVGNEGFYGAVFSSGSLNVYGSLFQDNTGAGSGIVANSGYGLKIVNSTFVGNEAGAREGIISSYGNLDLEHVTVTRNVIEGDGAAVEVRGDATGSNILNSIIIDNQNDGTAPSEVAGKDGALTEDIEFLGSNIVGADADAFDASGEENAINADPALIFEEEVADNGGPVPTLALLANAENPAIDADSVTSQETDARGEDRAVDILGIANGGDVDLGAFELQRDEAPDPFEVRTLDDIVDNTDGLVSLREAILAANATPGEDVITFADGLEGTIRLIDGDIFANGDLVIDGDGRIAISGDANGDDVTDANGITDVDASFEAGLLADNSRLLLHVNGTLELTGLTLTGGTDANDGVSAGGAVRSSGTIVLSDSEVSGNLAFASGGGLFADNDVFVTDSVISGNVALDDGGGVFASGDVTVVNSQISDNFALRDGGGAHVGGAVSVTDSVIRDNNAEGNDGGFYSGGDVRVERSEVIGNAGDFAGGFRNDEGSVDVIDSVIAENTSNSYGGLVSSGTITITGSLFQDNVGGQTGAVGFAGYDNTDDRVVNSTFVGNEGGSRGGAIYARSAELQLDHVTITGNTSAADAAAVTALGTNRRVDIANSIITSNNGGGVSGPDLAVRGRDYVPYSGTIDIFGVSIIGEDDSAFGDSGQPFNVINAAAADIFVDVVADKGGPTPTLALKKSADNVAVDASDFIAVSGDARGRPRPVDVEGVDNYAGDGAVDLGAYELNVANLNGVGVNVPGEFGAEELFGTEDDDVIQGGASFEDSLPGSGQDTIRGFGGDDLLTGEGGADLIFGGSGDDTINGGGDFGDRADTIFGGDGDDDISGEDASDELFGGAGDDTIRVTETDLFGGFDAIDGGDDVDTIDFSGATGGLGFSVNLATGAQARFGEGDTPLGVIALEARVLNVENATGGDGDDSFAGDDGANALIGGEGDDTLEGGGGNDTLDGGEGVDTADFSDATSDTLAVLLNREGVAQSTLSSGRDTFIGIENLIGSDFD
ncbi:MAG: choice-of-anchor Q domain-containing protein, partial [Pseudomonadota bacterium]